MNDDKETALKKALESLCSSLDVQGYLLTFIDSGKLHFLGSANLSTVFPFLMDRFLKR